MWSRRGKSGLSTHIKCGYHIFELVAAEYNLVMPEPGPTHSLRVSWVFRGRSGSRDRTPALGKERRLPVQHATRPSAAATRPPVRRDRANRRRAHARAADGVRLHEPRL